jgi:hypothetical protein
MTDDLLAPPSPRKPSERRYCVGRDLQLFIRELDDGEIEATGWRCGCGASGDGEPHNHWKP